MIFNVKGEILKKTGKFFFKFQSISILVIFDGIQELVVLTQYYSL